MITVKEALLFVLNEAGTAETELVPLSESVGRVLQEEIVADRDFPPYNRVAMDGIALQFDQVRSIGQQFSIEGIQAAGDPQKRLEKNDACLEIMTGAVLSANTDTVIPYEWTTVEDGVVTLNQLPAKKGQHIHAQGADNAEGDVLLRPGAVIGPGEINVLSSVGKPEVRVAKLPKVAVISTGDELVEVDQMPEAHQIRKSNTYTLAASLREEGIESVAFHFNDELDVIQRELEKVLNEFPIVMMSGGVSMGKFDYLPQAMENLGVTKVFHKIKQRPGKPFWFGKYQDKSVVFAFPGNPVSTFVNYYVYFKPWLDQHLGREYKQMEVLLGEDVTFEKPLTYFMSTRLEIENGSVIAYPVRGTGSGHLTNLPKTDGLLILPADASEFSKGQCFPFIAVRSALR